MIEICTRHASVLDAYAKARSMKAPHGHVLDECGNAIADTAQCAHCGKHFVLLRDEDSGWCFSCGSIICSGHACNSQCVPFEQQLLNEERRG